MASQPRRPGSGGVLAGRDRRLREQHHSQRPAIRAIVACRVGVNQAQQERMNPFRTNLKIAPAFSIAVGLTYIASTRGVKKATGSQ